jgi:anti-anti-sigma factor
MSMKSQSSSVHRGAFIRQSSDAGEIIHVFGEVDMVNESEFRESILKAADRDCPIVVDLTKCTFFCSSGLHVLFDLSNGRLAGSLSVRVSRQIARLFEVVGLTSLIEATEPTPL